MRTAVTAVLVSLLSIPAAWAQTTSSTMSAPTTVGAPGSTMPPPPPGPRPPDAFLASGSSEVRGEFQLYCWSEPPLGVCADRFDPIDPAVALTVAAGAPVTLRFDRPISPTSITVSRSDRPAFPFPADNAFQVSAGNPTQFVADFPPGTYFLSVYTRWAQGDATYVFEINVVGASTTTTGAGDTCNGLTPTVVGTDGRDAIFGTPGADVISGRGGNDAILGLGGDDVICGGAGADAVIGGAGSDQILGEAGDDHLTGQEGDDAILGGPGNDRLSGGAGTDSLSGGDGSDLCLGGLGVDTQSACETTSGVP